MAKTIYSKILGACYSTSLIIFEDDQYCKVWDQLCTPIHKQLYQCYGHIRFGHLIPEQIGYGLNFIKAGKKIGKQRLPALWPYICYEYLPVSRCCGSIVWKWVQKFKSTKVNKSSNLLQ